MLNISILKPGKRTATLLPLLGLMVLASSSPSAAQGVCEGFDRKHTITRLGGENAFAPGGTHTRTRAELQQFFAANAGTIRGILAGRGLDNTVADALLEAVRQDRDITERTMRDGERLEWMAYRSEGEARTIENVCVDLPGYAPAFVITLPVKTAAGTAARPDCSIDVKTDLQPSGTSTFQVRSAPGARVTMDGPAGPRTIIEGGASTWTGPWDDPYGASTSFTVTNEVAIGETVTTYTFLVPRECLNLALLGKTDEPRAGKSETCSESRAVPKVERPPVAKPDQPVPQSEVFPVEAAPQWIVRPFASYLFASGETSGSLNPGACPCPAGTSYGYDNGFGLGVGLERLFTERIGVEARGFHARLRDEFEIGANGIGITESGRRSYWDLSLGLNIHLTPKSGFDWYAGPFVGYSTVKGRTTLVVDRSLELDTKGGLSWGVQTGLDWHLGQSPWSLHAGARYTRYAPDVTYRYTNPTGAVLEQRQSIDLHPIGVELGVAYHF